MKLSSSAWFSRESRGSPSLRTGPIRAIVLGTLGFAVSHAPAVAALSGSVVAWGNEQFGEPTVPEAARRDVAGIAAGTAHLVALKSDGTVIQWGINDPEAQIIPGITNAVAVAAGRAHSVALLADGTVVAWGENFAGQTNVPPGLSNVVAVSAAADHTVALRSDGRLAGWGDNSSGQLSFPDDLPPVVSVATGLIQTVAIFADGSSRSWRLADGRLTEWEGPSQLKSVASGAGQHIAIREDGGVVVWGEYRGPIGLPPDLREVTAIAARADRFIVARRDGAAVAWRTYWWRDPAYDLIPNPADLSDVVALACGDTYSMALVVPRGPRIVRQPTAQTREHLQSAQFSVETEETLLTYQWRFNGVPLEGATQSTLILPMVRQDVDAGLYDVVASNPAGSVTSDAARLTILPASPGIVVAWGSPDIPSPIVPDAARTGLDAVAAGHFGGASLKRDGSVVSWPEPAPSNLGPVIAVAAGVSHWLALRADGRVVAWGNGERGQTNIPSDLSGVVAIAAGGFHNLALRADGTVATWGDNSAGQAGLIPITNALAISAGYRHSVALRKNGSVVAWGNYGLAPLEMPLGLSEVRAVAAGGMHTLALKSDGTVVAWGNNSRRQTTVPAGLSNVVAVAAGFEFSMALREDGRVVTWGSDDIGPPPSGLVNVAAVAAGADFALALVAEDLAPRLQLARIPAGLRATWPTFPGTFTLQARETLNYGDWEAVPGTAIPNAGVYTLDLPSDLSGQLFRLFKP